MNPTMICEIKLLSQATWSNADADCRARTGGSLVGIEDDDEWEFLNIQLENYQFGMRR